MTLPATGTLAYNGVAFDSLFSIKVSARTMLSDSGRVAKSVQHTLDISGWVAGDVTVPDTGTLLASMRQLLTEPGGSLRFEGKGYDTLNVNVAGGQNDVAWGPKPEMVSWDPVGNNRGALIKWRVTTCVPEQANARDTGLVTYEYDCSWDIDDDGYTMVTTTGYVEIAQTRPRGGGRVVRETADDYREDVAPPLIKGFRRRQRFQLSKDRLRLDYTITDQQVPYPLPEGITNADVDHEIESSLQQGFANWTGSISGHVTLPPGGSKKDAWLKILRIVFGRLGMNLIGNVAQVPVNQKRARLIDRVRINNSLFKNVVRFTITYRVWGATLADLLGGNGLFEPVKDTDFTKWRLSMESLAGVGGQNVRRGAWRPRGSAGLAFRPEEDILLDLGTGAKPRTQHFNPNLGAPGGPDVPKGKQGKIDPKESFVFYECRAIYTEYGRVVTHKPLKEVKPRKPSVFDPLGRIIGIAAGVADAITLGPLLHTIQMVGGPKPTITFVGRALRLQYKIDQPKVEKIGGIPVGEGPVFNPGEAALGDVEFHTWVAGRFGDVPIIAARWRIEYHLPRTLEGDGYPGNVSLGVDPG